ncbi:MAG: hypothetical protein DWQ36_01190 [Acidobacteria bacterium]|nr:MAG: hypothetical protein DWQ30_13980 [Acidobacteriota bacterium]REK11628.1 MAG: hypothetical protein DWQ36_01190 [Acidobacteriota bacterium]
MGKGEGAVPLSRRGRRSSAAVGAGASPNRGAQAGCGHLALRFEVDARWEDDAAARLFEIGCLGVQPAGGLLAERLEARGDRLPLEAIFPPLGPGGEEGLRERARAALDGLGDEASCCRIVGVAELPPRDWLAEYRARAQPITTARFVFDPRDPDEPAEAAGLADAGDRALPPEGAGARQRHRLLLPAEQAFGTGSHPTTRLMVDLLEQRRLEGARLLDVGSGSGILCLVARRLGARAALGVEIDPCSSFVAARNAERNRLPLQLVCGTVACLGESARGGFELVAVNVLPHRIEGQEAAIAAALADGGELLLSGVLSEQRQEIEGRWRDLGLECVETAQREEWIALVLARRKSDAL